MIHHLINLILMKHVSMDNNEIIFYCFAVIVSRANNVFFEVKYFLFTLHNQKINELDWIGMWTRGNLTTWQKKKISRSVKIY